MFVNAIRRVVPRAWRNALRNPMHSLRRVQAKARFALGDVDVVEPRPGWRVRCHPLCPELFSIFRSDSDQAAELEDFISYCRPGMKLIDVGAHWGLFTLAALQFGAPKAQVLAVEASPEAARVCRRNLELNQVGEVVTIITAAAGAECGELDMLTTGAGGADYFVVPAEPRPDTTRVPQVTLSAICREHGLEPSHIKIDVEGLEQEVLEGAEEIIKQNKPIVCLELHGSIIRSRGLDPRAVLSKLDHLGYRFTQSGHDVNVLDLEARAFNTRLVCLPNGNLLHS